jgi:hypothetical protein
MCGDSLATMILYPEAAELRIGENRIGLPILVHARGEKRPRP